MVLSMPRDNGNIYQAARKAAGLTQEAAAERLAVSVESMRAYETGLRLPGDDVVTRMMAVYDAQYLGAQHLQCKPWLLPECVMMAKPEPLPVAVIKLVRRVMAFAEAHRSDQLMEIAEDGVISEGERDLFNEIATELGDIVQAALALEYAKEV